MKVWVRMVPLVVVFGLTSCSMMLGLKIDCKYNVVKDHLSFGAGLAAGAIWWGSYIVEGSLYAGCPSKVVSPYFVGRTSAVVFGERRPMPVVTFGGLKFDLWRKLSLYVELGGMLAFEPEARLTPDLLYTGGLGLSIGQ